MFEKIIKFWNDLDRKPKLLPSIERLKDDQIVCEKCQGKGFYMHISQWHYGPRLTCHRCKNGVTTIERQRTAIEWERVCWSENLEERNKASKEYADARINEIEN